MNNKELLKKLTENTNSLHKLIGVTQDLLNAERTRRYEQAKQDQADRAARQTWKAQQLVRDGVTQLATGGRVHIEPGGFFPNGFSFKASKESVLKILRAAGEEKQPVENGTMVDVGGSGQVEVEIPPGVHEFPFGGAMEKKETPPKGSPQPWVQDGLCIRDSNGKMIVDVGSIRNEAHRDRIEQDSKRTVTCVNACQGINPQAVPLMKEIICTLSRLFNISPVRIEKDSPLHKSIVRAGGLIDKQA